MAGLLIAASPVEIGVKAEEAGMPDAERDAALHLFHDLTSRLELNAIAMDPADGEDWPRHRFYFGAAPGPMDRLRHAMAAIPDLVEARPEPAVADGSFPVLFVTGEVDGFAAVLLAGSDVDWLARVAAPLERAATA